MAPTRRTLAGLRAKSEGALAAGTLRPEESLDAVWQHLCEGLTALAERGGAEQQRLPENGLTQRLFTELERRPGCRPYFFDREHMVDDSHGRSPRADLVAKARDGGAIVVNGVTCGDGQCFLVLEAKRLPTDRASREREYLIGENHTGGVERFKLGIYAHKLKTVGIIAYIQHHRFDHWRDTINTWVDELIAASRPELPWDERDKLQMEEMSPLLAKLQSSNLRVTDNQPLTMRHLWVQLAKDSVREGAPPEDQAALTRGAGGSPP